MKSCGCWIAVLARLLAYLALMGSGLVACQNPELAQTAVPPTSTLPPRIAQKSDLGLSEAWRVHTGAPVAFTEPQSNLLVSDGKVLFPDETNSDELSFTAISLDTGRVVWNTPYRSTPSGTEIDSAVLDTKRLYFVDQWKVWALDLETGHIAWTSDEFPGHTGYDFRPWEPVAPLRLHADTGIEITIDPDTGKVLSREPERGLPLTYGSIEFVGTYDELSARDLASNTVLWTHAVQQVNPMAQMWFWPSFIGQDVVYLSGQVTYAITRADLHTGRILWQTDALYVSNFTLDEAHGRLYAMEKDGLLAVLDVNTGTMLGDVRFSGPLIVPNVQNYSVASSGPYVIINFVDTQDIIALRWP